MGASSHARTCYLYLAVASAPWVPIGPVPKVTAKFDHLLGLLERFYIFFFSLTGGGTHTALESVRVKMEEKCSFLDKFWEFLSFAIRLHKKVLVAHMDRHQVPVLWGGKNLFMLKPLQR